METPGLSISDLVIAVRNETRDLTLGQQSPWDQSSLLSQFYFTEQQQFDAAALIAAATEISQDPRLRAAFAEAQDEGLSFQAAVFRTKQRAVELLGQPAGQPDVTGLYASADARVVSDADTNAPAPTTVVIGSSAPQSNSIDDDQMGVIGALMFSRPGEENTGFDKSEIERTRKRELATAMQTELSRLGCYRLGIDGLWGKGSRNAFSEYLRRTKQSADTLDPTVGWHSRLMLESGRICRRPAPAKPSSTRVARRTDPKATTGSRRSSSRSFKQRAVKGQSRPAQRARRAQRKTALPPDLSMGIGIGL